MIGLYYGRGVNTIQTYAVGDRKFSTLSIAATIVATYVSGDLFIAYVAETYKEGLFFIIAAFSGVICLLTIGWLFGPKMKEFFSDLSVAETMGRLYGRKVRIITAFASIGLAIGMTAVQIKVFSTVFAHFFSVPSLYAVLVSSFIVIFYSAFGGIRSVVVTDIFQFFSFSVFIPMFTLFLWHGFSNYDLIKHTLNTNPLFDYKQLFNYQNPKFLPNLFIFFWCLIPSMNSAMFQRILMARDTAQIKSSFTIAAVLCFFILLFICFIGLMMIAVSPNLEANNVVMHAIDICSSPILRVFALIGIIAMVMSTADSWINTTAIIIAHDLLKPLGIDVKNELVLVRIASFVVGIGAIILAIPASNLLNLALLSANFYMPIVTIPLIISILGFRTSKRVVLISMCMGTFTVIAWKQLLYPVTNIDSVMPAMIVNIITIFTLHYILKEPGGWIGKALY